MKKFPVFYRNRFSSVTAHSKGWVCGHSLPGIACSNPAGGMDVRLLFLFCFVSYMSCDWPIPCQEGSYRVCASSLHLQWIVINCQTKKGRRNFCCQVCVSRLFCLYTLCSACNVD